MVVGVCWWMLGFLFIVNRRKYQFEMFFWENNKVFFFEVFRKYFFLLYRFELDYEFIFEGQEYGLGYGLYLEMSLGLFFFYLYGLYREGGNQNKISILLLRKRTNDCGKYKNIIFFF